MNIVYIHGLNSDANSTKGVLLESYCRQHYPRIKVLRPDLNQPPAQVFEKLTNLIANLEDGSKTVLVGSSLGGYFSTLVSNHTGCPVLLLNPSIQPHITLQRFSDGVISPKLTEKKVLDDKVIHTTEGGWVITNADLRWFAEHQLCKVTYPKKVAVFIKEGDELLKPYLSKSFYQQHDAVVILQAGGDHRFSDFSQQLPMLMDTLLQL